MTYLFNILAIHANNLCVFFLEGFVLTMGVSLALWIFFGFFYRMNPWHRIIAELEDNIENPPSCFTHDHIEYIEDVIKILESNPAPARMFIVHDVLLKIQMNSVYGKFCAPKNSDV